MYAKLMWEEKDFVTHLLGFEYSDMIYNSSNYDLENDFPAVFTSGVHWLHPVYAVPGPVLWG